MNFRERSNQNARLVVLKALNKQVGGHLNDSLISGELEIQSHKWSRDQVRDLLRWLESMGAVKITEAGTSLIAAIALRGIEHLERRAVIEGIQRPSPED